MATFQDHLAADAAVFLNPDEFGQPIEWNGKSQWYDADTQTWRPLTAIKEDGETAEGASSGFGYNSEFCRLHLLPAAIDPHPVPGEQVSLNGEFWRVDKASIHDGILICDLSRHLS